MAEKIRATYSVTEPTRKLLGWLSGELRVQMSEVFTAAVNSYVDALDAGSATVPEHSSLGDGARVPRMTVYPEKSARARLTEKSKELGVPLGRMISGALTYYREAVESGLVSKPEPRPLPTSEPTPKPKPKPKRETAKDATMPPRKKPAPAITRPLARPALNDRAECGTCRKQVAVDDETSLLTDHIAHPSVRPRGVFALCEGSGQQPAGPVIHAAETDYRK